MSYRRIEVEVPKGMDWDPFTSMPTRKHYRSLPEHIGPHYGREMGLMLHHGKPMATIQAFQAKDWTPTAVAQGWGMFKNSGTGHYVVVRNGEHPRFLAYARSRRMWESGAIGQRTWDIRMGLLLGYPRRHIACFIAERHPRSVNFSAA